MPKKIEDLEKLWDESARCHADNRALAIHFTENGQPVAESIYQDIFDQINQLVCFTAQDRVLEVGAGSGLLLERIAVRVKEAIGTDISAEMLKLVPLAQNLSVRRMDSDNLDFADEIFDKVICNAVFQCFPDAAYAERCLREMIRVCKTGGRIYIGDIFNAYLKDKYLEDSSHRLAFSEQVKHWLRALLGRPDQNYDPLFLYPYQLSEWVEKAGCREFKALLSLSTRKPLLFRMYRFDVLIMK